MKTPLLWTYNDGGRKGTGRSVRNDAGDCVVRSIAIATGRMYETVYRDIADLSAAMGGRRTARDGVSKKIYRPYIEDECDGVWTPTMGIGTGTTVRLALEDFPRHGRYIVAVSKHMTAVIDGVVHDTFDPTRDGTRCVYGYFKVWGDG